ncbi:hypothetical protein NDU88_000384 [Pleurodeles waltl]|uniref:Uncharacterized protein n=1 Tax=Pleurodeles waltl TaxID=8319 RepID=A0AAV7WFC7_PLEWA|nr:hypothetical protein NDU88_000384 [Pleurodeles waltl]
MNLRSFWILPRSISNHASLFAERGDVYRTHQLIWRLNAWHQKSPECVSFVEEELEAFFQHIVGSVASGAMVWASSKPTVRGVIKSYIREQERRQWAHCEQPETKILEQEGRARCPDKPVVQRQLVLAWSELCQISLEEAKQCW